ncbi:hypothetical protein M8332_06890 (plasmid) [Fructilactobacillus ixorae]|uniref:Uncharacterized protein n=1 Tax=Fructilactobacillus ixorae TaxID=1750535 RepID=A0ABY5C6J7_9LACO|nr:hypothetical protein [Fructilactobacillus ixorae]USS94007.1 hypothetical protein M8332_06890 [Fructilactobacillus ixorae]
MATALDKMMSNQFNQKVDYEVDGEKHTRNISVKKPGYLTDLKLKDLMNVGDQKANFGRIFEILMNEVLVQPQWTYSILDKKLPKKLREKEVAVDVEGQTKKVKLVFPGYRLALNTLLMITSPISGAYNMSGFMESVITNMVRTTEGNKVEPDFFDPGQPGDGLGDEVMKQATPFLNDIASYDGVLPTLLKAYTFLAEKD